MGPGWLQGFSVRKKTIMARAISQGFENISK
jgi:hypothetical protein